MNEFGETPKLYVWPEGHNEGDKYPDDFWERLHRGLESVGIEWEAE